MAYDTIVATATPHGTGGVSLLRLSGPSSFTTLQLCTKKPLSHFKPRKATLCDVYDSNDYIIDRCLISFFPSPNSYTGEDVVEVSCHGNPVIADNLIDCFLVYGLRLAEPGEFTQRAFLNGKMDLVQAESVSVLISSKSKKSAKLANSALNGRLSDRVKLIRGNLFSVLSECEYELDISEEEMSRDFNIRSMLTVTNEAENCKNLSTDYNNRRLYFSEASVAIAGKPNVGKSTLFNALIGSKRSIVGKGPGTTRDYIDIEIIIQELPVRLIDTAGIRKPTNPVEKEGVRRSLDAVENSDLVIQVYDNIDNIEHTERSIVVINKIDINKYHNFSNKTNKAIPVSAKTKEGIPKLKRAIHRALIGNKQNNNNVAITTKRQALSIDLCRKHLVHAKSLLNNSNVEYELLALELRDAISQLDSILGINTRGEVLKNIFNNFCVGK